MMRTVFRRAIAATLLYGLLVGVAAATDLRGLVTSPVNYGMYPAAPRPGMPVTLALLNQGGELNVVQETITNPGGFYFFFGIHPGFYVLLVGPMQFPLQVNGMPAQDIPPILATW
ncbi:MAG TPA: hypothetical protein VGF43_12845 [Dongiaceae bacterium]